MLRKAKQNFRKLVYLKRKINNRQLQSSLPRGPKPHNITAFFDAYLDWDGRLPWDQ